MEARGSGDAVAPRSMPSMLYCSGESEGPGVSALGTGVEGVLLLLLEPAAAAARLAARACCCCAACCCDAARIISWSVGTPLCCRLLCCSWCSCCSPLYCSEERGASSRIPPPAACPPRAPVDGGEICGLAARPERAPPIAPDKALEAWEAAAVWCVCAEAVGAGVHAAAQDMLMLDMLLLLLPPPPAAVSDAEEKLKRITGSLGLHVTGACKCLYVCTGNASTF
jgi:hypothetical protein